MRTNPNLPSISKTGVLFIPGYGSGLRVSRGQLVVRANTGRDTTETVFAKVNQPALRRLVIFGSGGYTSWEAISWIHGIGASFAYISRAGKLIASSAQQGPDIPALRRAQVAACGSDTGLAIAKLLLRRKLEGQERVLSHDLQDASAAEVVGHFRSSLEDASSVKEALVWEAKAAAVYWPCWRDVSVTFAKLDRPKVPTHWLSFGDRHSPLSSSPRSAATPACATLNLLYSLTELECRVALVAMDLDPGLGWFHRDSAYRPSAALDLMEAVRPVADHLLHEVLDVRIFPRQDFVELASGQVRLSSGLARELAETYVASFERAVAPIAEEVAKLLASSSVAPVRIRTRLTRADRRRGRMGVSADIRGKTKAACHTCGVILDDPDRRYCEVCLEEFDRERTEKLKAAGTAALRAMRASADDPARSPEARAKLSATASRRDAERRAWDREHGGKIDPARYERDIRPVIEKTGTAELARRTGLSKHYCWQVRKGVKRLHPRHWQAVLDGP